MKDIFSQIKIFQNHPNEDAYIIKGGSLYSIQLNKDVLSTKLITDQLPEKEFIKYIQIDKLKNSIAFFR